MKEKQVISGSGKLAAQSAAVTAEVKSTPPKRVITGSGALAAQPAGAGAEEAERTANEVTGR